MSAATEEPQQYKMYMHEFKASGEKVKSGYSFSLEVAKGKALNNIKTSAVAKDLLTMLQQSKRAQELMSEASYELKMDKQFTLHIIRKELVPEDVEDEAHTERS